MRRPSLRLALLLAVAVGGWSSALPVAVAAPASSAEASAAPGAAALAERLRTALEAADWDGVRRSFVSPSDPVLAYLAARWHDMRRGALDPVAWEVEWVAYDDRPASARGQLAVAARLQDGSLVGRRFDLQLERRGERYLYGEPIRYDAQDVRLVAHALDVDLQAQNAFLQAEDQLTLRQTGPDRNVYLLLAPELRVSAVLAGETPLPFAQRREVLSFERPAGGDDQRITVRYAGRPAPSKQDFIGPEGSVLRSDYRWYPRMPYLGSFCDFTLRARVPGGQAVISAGVRQAESEAGVFRFATTTPIEGLSLYAGTYAKVEGQMGELQLEAFTEPGSSRGGALALAEAARVLDFFGKRFGAFPFERLALVSTDFPGGYGAPSAIALPRGAFDQPELLDEYLSHEIAHNWTDRLSYRGTLGERAFMAEGVATYLDALYKGARGGAAAQRRVLQSIQARYRKLASTPADVALAEASQLMPQDAWQALAYDKGAMVLHMLRAQIGAPAFERGLASLYARPGTAVDLDAFRLAFERASGQQLGYFFEQWVRRPGVPVLQPRIDEVKALPGGRYQVTGQLLQKGTAYAMRVPLVVVSEQGEALYRVDVRSLATDFTLLTRGRPRVMLLDPLGDVLLAPSTPLTFR